MSKKYQPEIASSIAKVNRIVNPEGSSNNQSNQLNNNNSQNQNQNQTNPYKKNNLIIQIDKILNKMIETATITVNSHPEITIP